MKQTIKFLIEIFQVLSDYEKSIGRTFPSIAFNTVKHKLQAYRNVEVVGDRVKVGNEILGASSSNVIIEFLSTGTSKRYEEARKSLNSVNPDTLDISEVTGIGDVKAGILHSHGVNSVLDLRNLNLEVGDEIGDSGVRFTEMMKVGLTLTSLTGNVRWTYADAKKLSEDIYRKLKSLVGDEVLICVCGSLRRKKPTIGDLDFVVVIPNKESRNSIIEQCKSIYDTLVVGGYRKISGVINNFQVDMRFINHQEIGCHVLHATGPAEHNQYLRGIAKSKGMKLNEYFIQDGDKIVYFSNEISIYEYLGVPYVKPEDR